MQSIGQNKKNIGTRKICIKYRTCCHFNDMIKFEDFDFGNIVSGKKSNRNILIYELCVICSIK